MILNVASRAKKGLLPVNLERIISNDLAATKLTPPTVTGTQKIVLFDYDRSHSEVPTKTTVLQGANFIDRADSNDYGYGVNGYDYSILDDLGGILPEANFTGLMPSATFKQNMTETKTAGGSSGGTISTVDGVTVFTEDTATAAHRIYCNGFFPETTGKGVFAALVETGSPHWLRVEERLSGGAYYSYFYCNGPGYVGNTHANHNATIQHIGGGKYLIILRISNISGAWNNIHLQHVLTDSGSSSYAGNGTRQTKLHYYNYYNTATPCVITPEIATSDQIGSKAVLPAREGYTATFSNVPGIGKFSTVLNMICNSTEYVPGSSPIVSLLPANEALLEFITGGIFRLRGTSESVDSAAATWSRGDVLYFECIFDSTTNSAQARLTNLTTGVVYTGVVNTGWDGFSAHTQISVGAGGSTQCPVFGGIKSIRITNETAFSTDTSALGGNPVIETVYSGSIAVPSNFNGIHAHDWPIADGQGNLSPSPTYGFGIFRTHDNSWARWAAHHTGPSTFSWAKMDEVMAGLQAGTDVIWTIMSTPTWASSGINADPYGTVGGNAPPTSMTTLYNYVNTLVSRYPTVKYVEVWNEPKFPDVANGFWNSTATKMAEMARTIYQAAKAANPSVKILAPGFVSNPDLLTQFLNASDANGGFGRDWIEGVAYHFYGVCGSSYLPNVKTNMYFEWVDRVRAAAVAGGLSYNIDLYDTEHGDDSSYYLSLTATQKGLLLKRSAVAAAVLGIKSIAWYSHDHTTLLRPAYIPEVAAALDDIDTLLAGKTITKVERRADQSLRVVTTTGEFIW